MIILLMGPPGSGKGTQAKRLEAAYHLPHISTGDLFRKNIADKTALGIKVKAEIEAGKYVDDQLVLDMLFDRVSEPDCANGYILDGFPRTLPQVEALEKHLEQQRIYVINIEVPDEVIVKRAEGRRVCQQCQKVFNLSDLSNATECSHCGGSLTQRPDDQKDAVQLRLSIYRDQTLPVINYYEKKGWVAVVDGARAPDHVFATIQLLLPAK